MYIGNYIYIKAIFSVSMMSRSPMKKELDKFYLEVEQLYDVISEDAGVESLFFSEFLIKHGHCAAGLLLRQVIIK